MYSCNELPTVCSQEWHWISVPAHLLCQSLSPVPLPGAATLLIFSNLMARRKSRSFHGLGFTEAPWTTLPASGLAAQRRR